MHLQHLITKLLTVGICEEDVVLGRKEIGIFWILLLCILEHETWIYFHYFKHNEKAKCEPKVKK